METLGDANWWLTSLVFDERVSILNGQHWTGDDLLLNDGLDQLTTCIGNAISPMLHTDTRRKKWSIIEIVGRCEAKVKNHFLSCPVFVIKLSNVNSFYHCEHSYDD